MKVRVSAGAFALVPMVLSVWAVAPADAALTCEGKPVTINLINNPGTPATGGDDVIFGTTGTDVINGLGGDDTICGIAGDDVIRGGAGNDVILPGAGDDELKGGGGFDTVSYSDAEAVGVAINLGVSSEQNTLGSDRDTLVDSFDNVTGSRFDDFLVDSIGNNTVKGGAGNDDILTHTGVDRLKGGTGLDSVEFVGASQGITFDLAVTAEQATGSGKKTVLGVEQILGTPFADTISGSDGADRLTGLSGADVLTGRGGDDQLRGNEGADQLKGGLGDDDCDGGASDGATDTQSGCETLTNFP